MVESAYEDAKTELLSGDGTAIRSLERVLSLEEKKGSRTVWGFKAAKHLVIATIQKVRFEVRVQLYFTVSGRAQSG